MLEGKKILVTGVATNDSIAYATAIAARSLGADVFVSAFPRDVDSVRELMGDDFHVVGADLTKEDDLDTLHRAIDSRWGSLDGALHAVAFAPRDALAGDFLATPSASVEIAMRTSAWSYAALARVLQELAPPSGGSLVGLDFDAGDRAWPIYNWMGVCKAALRSVSKYVARDLGAAGIRSNLVAAGPLSTRAALGIPNFSLLTEAWDTTSPLAWSSTDASPVADVVCFLLSDFARAITGELLHVDGGYHAMARTRSEQGGSAGL